MITGYCANGWERVRDAFGQNFAERDELGAGVTVVHRGETVVDLAGGWFDQERTRAFAADDLMVFFSATKGMVATAAHWLIDRGLLDLHAPVSRYWPEYAQNGKDATTVAMLLNHSAGVPGFHEPLKQDAYRDWDYMVERIAAERPFWEPGLRNGYHALNFGWTVGELVRRVSGKGLGEFFRETIAEPLGADIWIGLPQSEEHRVSNVIPTFPGPDEPVIEVYANVQENPQSDSALVFTNSGGWSLAATDEASGDFIMNTRAHHAAVFGGAGGIGNARGLAKVYAALDTGKLISRDHVARMSQTSMCATRDAILLVPTRFALGYMKSMDNRGLPLGEIKSFIVGEKAFGHVGAGGSFGMLDREEGLAAGYVMNRLGKGVWLDERGQALIDAMYLSLGYRTNAPGVWVKCLLFSKRDEAFRAEVRAHFDARIPQVMHDASKLMTSVYAKRRVMDHWQATLHEKGWGAPAWAVEYGGCDWTPAQHFIFAEEKARAGAPPYLSLGAVMCGAVIIAFGTAQQKRRFLPPMISGEEYWCQGYSEPGSGSDLAALSLRAEEDGSDFVLNGSKIWTSHAHEADWMYALVRSTQGSRLQNGITFLLLDMRSPGIEVRPIVFLTGEHIQNEVVFRNVRVPIANAVGEPGKGWTVAKYLMEFERGGQLWSPEHEVKLEGIAAFAEKIGLSDPSFLARLAAARIDLMTMRALEWRDLSARDGSPGVSSSMLKVMGTELSQRLTELALEAGGYGAFAYQPGLAAPGGETPWPFTTVTPPVVAPEAAAFTLRYFNDRAGSIYAGSNEIQRNILAKRQLGL